MNTPFISVIMPLYNNARFLALALDSALAQTFRDFEIVVVDDGSTDGSGALADSYARRYPQLVRVVHQPNRGVCHARNAGLAAARGACFALLDPDDIWLPHHLAAAAAVLERQPDVALVHADIERIDVAGRFLGRTTRLWDSFDADAFVALYLRWEHVCCPTAVFRRSAVDAVGAFDPQFNRLGCEDRDLWLRIAATAPIVFLNDVHARYRLHGGTMSANFARMRQARLRLVEKFAALPLGKALRRRALAAADCNLGDELMDAERRRDAFRAYARAFAQQPLEQKALRGMLRCLLKPRGAAVRVGANP